MYRQLEHDGKVQAGTVGMQPLFEDESKAIYVDAHTGETLLLED